MWSHVKPFDWQIYPSPHLHGRGVAIKQAHPGLARVVGIEMLTWTDSDQSLLTEDVWLQHGNVHMKTGLTSYCWSWTYISFCGGRPAGSVQFSYKQWFYLTGGRGYHGHLMLRFHIQNSTLYTRSRCKHADMSQPGKMGWVFSVWSLLSCFDINSNFLKMLSAQCDFYAFCP